MNYSLTPIHRLAVLIMAVLLSACDGYSGSNLKTGVATLPEVIASMGEPAMRWTEADGREQLAYPRGPGGNHTYMVFLSKDGHLERIKNVLDYEHFGRIQPGMSKEDVLRLIGPSQPQWTMYFKARDELAWEWRFCNSWNEQSRFDVLFDGTTGIVRSTLQLTEMNGPDGGPTGCSH